MPPRAPPTWSENVTVNETARANLLATMFHVRETLESSGTQAFKSKYKEISEGRLYICLNIYGINEKDVNSRLGII